MKFTERVKREYTTQQKRQARQEEVASWFEAADLQTGPMTRQQILAALEKKNSYRMWRIRHDFKWLKRQLKKMGQNPEDARELL